MLTVWSIKYTQTKAVTIKKKMKNVQAYILPEQNGNGNTSKTKCSKKKQWLVHFWMEYEIETEISQKKKDMKCWKK